MRNKLELGILVLILASNLTEFSLIDFITSLDLEIQLFLLSASSSFLTIYSLISIILTFHSRRKYKRRSERWKEIIHELGYTLKEI